MTATILRTMPTWLLGLLVVAGAVGATVLGARLAGRTERSDNPAVGGLHATISTVYTVVLAFVVVIVWQQFTDAAALVETEATRASNIARDAGLFGEPTRTEIRVALRDYLATTSTSEWQAMARGEPDPKTAVVYEALWGAIYRVEPSGPREEAGYAEVLARMNELGAARRGRLVAAESSVPAVLWVLLVLGAVAMVGVSYLLPGSRRPAGLVALAAAAGTVALTLFLVLALDHPFTGGVHVDPGPLEAVRARL